MQVNSFLLALGAGISKSNANSSTTNYNNTELLAANGKIKINSLNNAEIKGANLLAQNIELNTVNNLNIESLQDQANSKSKSWGINLGGGAGLSGSGGSGNFGINYNNSKTDKLWVENQTSIIGTNSVQINTGKNTNLVGAVIANQDANGNDLGNIALNTNTLTYSNLYDHDYQQSSGFGFSTSIGVGGSGGASNNTTGQGTAPANNPNQQNNFYPNGSTNLALQDSGYQKEQTSLATIGAGNITTGATTTFDANGNLITSTGGTILAANDSSLSGLNRDTTKTQIITKDTVTGALDVNVTVDNRLIASAMGNDAAWNSLKSDQKNLGKNLAHEARTYGEGLEDLRELAENKLGTGGKILTAPTSLAEGTIFTFFEKKDDIEGSPLFNLNTKTKELTLSNDPTKTTNYAVNGIDTTIEDLDSNYFSKKDTNLTLRYNPTHGFLGDIVESGLGKVADWFGVENAIAMNRIVAEDMNDRKDIPNAVNLFHSQGTIIGKGAMQIYADQYMEPVLVYQQPDKNNQDWANKGGSLRVTQPNQIDPTQKFVAVGPAVLKEDWEYGVQNNLRIRFKEKDYIHDSEDPVRYFAAPTNLVSDSVRLTTGKNINSPIYIPNPVDFFRGFKNLPNIDQHNVTNPIYYEPLQPKIEPSLQSKNTKAQSQIVNQQARR